MRLITRLLVLTPFLTGTITVRSGASDLMIHAEVHGMRVEGTPLYYTPQKIQMILRDGRLLDFAPDEARNFRKTAAPFRSYTTGEMRNRLSREFGKQFEVTGTGHYLVVHPRGQKDLWADRFEDLYRNFVHYFSVRGLQLKRPKFALVAVVWRNKREYRQHAHRTGVKISEDVIGYYSPVSNRIHLYDAAANQHDRFGWQQNASTIIHEATHQTAFNTGVHMRFAPTPIWVVEGLGTLFESRGIHSSRQYSKQGDRINRGRLRSFKQSVRQLKAGFLVDLVSSDAIFESDPQQAYALGWALTFYLVETQSHRFSKYLKRTSQLAVGEAYSDAHRLADFAAVFGDSFAMQESRFMRFMKELK